MAEYSLQQGLAGGHQWWFVPPKAPTSTSDAPLVITLQHLHGPDLQPHQSAQNISGPFQLNWVPATAPKDAQVTIDSSVLLNSNRKQLWQQWMTFLAALDQLEGIDETGAQYTAPGGSRMIAKAVVEQMPMLLSEIPVYQQGLSYPDQGSFIDLQVGTRLKVTHSNVYAQAPTGQGDINIGYSGTGTAYVELVSSSDHLNLAFDAFLDTQAISIKTQKHIDGLNSELNLAATVLDLAGIPLRPHHRLYFPQKILNNDEVALHVDTSYSLESEFFFSDFGSTPYASTDSTPTVFFGRCDITPEILIKVNGKHRYVPVGTTVQQILEAESLMAALPSSFKMKRYFEGAATTIDFSSKDLQAALNLPVASGDQLTWLSLGNNALTERFQAFYNLADPTSIENYNAGDLLLQVIASYPAPEPLPAPADVALALKNIVALAGFNSVSNIALAIYNVYTNLTARCPGYDNNMLLQALNFAGYDSKDLVTGLNSLPSTPTTGKCAYFVEQLIACNVGLTPTQIAEGIYQAYYNSSVTKAAELAEGMLNGSYNVPSGTMYSLSTVAIAMINGMNNSVKNTYSLLNVFELASALVNGTHNSAHAQLKGASADIANALFVAYQSINLDLDVDNMAKALAKAQLAAANAFTVEEVTTGCEHQFPDTTPMDMGGALMQDDHQPQYTVTDIAQGVYAVDTYPTPAESPITAKTLANVLYKQCKGSPTASYNNVAKALVTVDSSFTAQTVASAIYHAWTMTSSGADLQQEMNDVATALEFAGFTANDTNGDGAGDALYHVFSHPHPSYLAIALAKGYANAGINQLEVADILVHNYQFVITAEEDVVTCAKALHAAFPDGDGGTNDAITDDSANALAHGFIITASSSQEDIDYLAKALVEAYGYTAIQEDMVPLAHALYDALPGINATSLTSALVYAFDLSQTGRNIEAMDPVAYAVADAMGYQTIAAPSQDNVNAVATALHHGFSPVDEQEDLVDLALALRHAFSKITASEVALGLVKAFQLPNPGLTQDNYNYIASAIATFGAPAVGATLVDHLSLATVNTNNLTTVAVAMQFAQFEASDVATVFGTNYGASALTPLQVSKALYTTFNDGQPASTFTADKCMDALFSIFDYKASSANFQNDVKALAAGMLPTYLGGGWNDNANFETSLQKVCNTLTAHYGISSTYSPKQVQEFAVGLQDAWHLPAQQFFTEFFVVIYGAFSNLPANDAAAALATAFELAETGADVTGMETLAAALATKYFTGVSSGPINGAGAQAIVNLFGLNSDHQEDVETLFEVVYSTVPNSQQQNCLETVVKAVGNGFGLSSITPVIQEVTLDFFTVHVQSSLGMSTIQWLYNAPQNGASKVQMIECAQAYFELMHFLETGSSVATEMSTLTGEIWTDFGQVSDQDRITAALTPFGCFTSTGNLEAVEYVISNWYSFNISSRGLQDLQLSSTAKTVVDALGDSAKVPENIGGLVYGLYYSFSSQGSTNGTTMLTALTTAYGEPSTGEAVLTGMVYFEKISGGYASGDFPWLILGNLGSVCKLMPSISNVKVGKTIATAINTVFQPASLSSSSKDQQNLNKLLLQYNTYIYDGEPFEGEGYPYDCSRFMGIIWPNLEFSMLFTAFTQKIHSTRIYENLGDFCFDLTQGLGQLNVDVAWYNYALVQAEINFLLTQFSGALGLERTIISAMANMFPTALASDLLAPFVDSSTHQLVNSEVLQYVVQDYNYQPYGTPVSDRQWKGLALGLLASPIEQSNVQKLLQGVYLSDFPNGLNAFLAGVVNKEGSLKIYWQGLAALKAHQSPTDFAQAQQTMGTFSQSWMESLCTIYSYQELNSGVVGTLAAIQYNNGGSPSITDATTIESNIQSLFPNAHWRSAYTNLIQTIVGAT